MGARQRCVAFSFLKFEISTNLIRMAPPPFFK